MLARKTDVEKVALDYTSDRVFEGVRLLDREAADRHRARVKRALARIKGQAAAGPDRD